jgi:RHS repeat-associated protein
MAVTNYYTVGGEIIGEKVGAGAHTDYLTDALGNVTATMNQSAAIVNTYRYKPYGGLLAKTGVGADPAFTWVGSQGYRQTSKKYSDVYIRARHDDTTSGRWTSTDLYWPIEPAYIYVHADPMTYSDPLGLMQGPWPDPRIPPITPLPPAPVTNCDRDKSFVQMAKTTCQCVQALSKADWGRVNYCIKELSKGASPPCPLLGANKQACMKNWCGTPCGEIHCVWKDECGTFFGHYCSTYCNGCFGGGQTCAASYPIFGCGYITMCMVSGPRNCSCVGGGHWPYCVIGHELAHMCGIHHNAGHTPNDLCNEVVGTCIEEACLVKRFI